MTLITNYGDFKIINGELFRIVQSPTKQIYLERYVGEELTIEDVKEVE